MLPKGEMTIGWARLWYLKASRLCKAFVCSLMRIVMLIFIFLWLIYFFEIPILLIFGIRHFRFLMWFYINIHFLWFYDILSHNKICCMIVVNRLIIFLFIINEVDLLECLLRNGLFSILWHLKLTHLWFSAIMIWTWALLPSFRW